MRFDFWVLLLACLLIGVIAEAKCPIGRYHIRGFTKDAKTSEPIDEVILFILSQDPNCPVAVEGNTKGPAKTGKNGEYAITLQFDTYSGYSFFRGDLCERKPSSILLKFSKRGYKIRDVVLKAQDLSSEKPEIQLPNVLMERISGHNN